MSQTKYDIFISYSRKDTAIADKICAALDKEGITYFIDRAGIGGGMEFPEVLAENITASTLFLFLASKNSYESKFTNSEITFAFNEKPKNSILPYIIDGSQMPKAMRFIFSGITWRTIKEHPIESVLVDDLLNLLGRKRVVKTQLVGQKVKPINNDNRKYKSYFVIIVIAAIIISSFGYWTVTQMFNNNIIVKEPTIPDDNHVAAKAENTIVDITSQTNISKQDSASKKVVTTKIKQKEERIVEKTSPASLQNSYSQKQISESNNPTTPNSKSDVNNVVNIKQEIVSTKSQSPQQREVEPVVNQDLKSYISTHSKNYIVPYYDNKGKYGYKCNDKIIIPAKYDNAYYFSEGLAAVCLNNKWGYIDKTGSEVIPLQYDNAFNFNGDLAMIRHGYYGFIDKTGKIVIPFIYDEVKNFSEGLVAANKNGKWEYIDKTGKVIIKLGRKYDNVGDFKDGLAKVYREYKVGFIDTNGKEVISLQYDTAADFNNNKALVELNGEMYYIDKEGNRI